MSWEWEWSRFAVAVWSGCLLSHTGSLVQLTTRNELASPSTLGMDGLAVALVLGAHGLGFLGGSAWPLELISLALGLGVAALLWLAPLPWMRLGEQRGQDFRFILLLGLSVNLLVGALFACLHFLAMAFNMEFPTQLWFGRVTPLGPLQTLGAVLVAAPLVVVAFRQRRWWRALLLGPGWCLGLGVPLQRLTREALVAAFVGNLWVISQFGAFSFLGLLCPLLLRQFSRYGAHPWRELTEGALWCGLGFALLDHACYNFTFRGAEVPVGLPAAFGGACALVVLLWRRAKQA